MNHYGTLTAANAYHVAMGNAAWSEVGVTDAQKTAALVRASAAVDGVYGERFPGRPTGGRAQELAWPRAGARDFCADEEIPSDEVPINVERAVYAAALVELARPGAMSPSVTPGRVTKREKVDDIEREFFGSESGPSADDLRPVISATEDALRCLLAPASGGGNVFVLRY